MTEWREWPAWRQVLAAAYDQVDSAATVGVNAARAVQNLAGSLAELAPDAFPVAVFDAVELLAAEQQAMAPIGNLRNVVYLAAPDGPHATMRAVGDLADRITRGSFRIGEVGATLIPDGGTVMIHSASSTVRAMLVAAHSQKTFDVVCTMALPIGEGVEMADALRADGFDVELIADELALEVLSGADVIFAGADALGPDRAVNKVGTADLATVAGIEGVDFYLVAASDKLLPAALFDAVTRQQGRGSLSEVIRLDAFSGVVTDLGVMSADDIERLAASLDVAEQLR